MGWDQRAAGTLETLSVEVLIGNLIEVKFPQDCVLLSFLFLPLFLPKSCGLQGLSQASGPMPTPVLRARLLSSPQIATRKAYGQALAKLGRAHDRIIALDGDTKNSTFSEIFRKEHPDRFIECYIAEQNMVGARGGQVGASARHRAEVLLLLWAAVLAMPGVCWRPAQGDHRSS